MGKGRAYCASIEVLLRQFRGNKLLLLCLCALCAIIWISDRSPRLQDKEFIKSSDTYLRREQATTDTNTDNRRTITKDDKKEKEEDDVRPFGPAFGQQLSLDLSGASSKLLNSSEDMENATKKIADRADIKTIGISSSKIFRAQGVSVIALLEDGHIIVQTWPEHGKALIDVIARDIRINFKEILQVFAEEYGGDLSKSVFSIKPRGDYNHLDQGGSNEGISSKSSENEDKHSKYSQSPSKGNTKDHKNQKLLKNQFEPFEIMGQHTFKQLILEKQSPYHNVAIYDHQPTTDYGFNTLTPTRSLFLNGIIQSNVDDEAKYHESLVHPAFVASSTPVQRVLLVGGGEGGTLREVLKWNSVEKVTIVDLDADIISVSRDHLPGYSKCTGFGTDSCFDDPRVEIFTEDFIKWFEKNVGSDICTEALREEKDLYDVVVVDLLDMAELPKDKKWEKYVYSESFFSRLSCSLNQFGVLVANFGKAPSFNGNKVTKKQDVDMYQRKIKKIQTMSAFFRHSRVYDAYIDSVHAPLAFAIGIVPDNPWSEDSESLSDDMEVVKELIDHGNVGINDFEGTPARVNLKLRRGLNKAAYPLAFYDGAVQHGFQHPTADWVGIYCLNPKHKRICGIPKDVFTEDYEEEWFEPHLNTKADKRSGFIAKRDIKKGHVTGMWDAATAMRIPGTDLERLKSFVDGQSDKYKELYNFLYIYGHDGGQGATGSEFYCSFLSLHTFANHDCNHNPNFRDMYSAMSWSQELWDQWNPVSARIMKELDHATIASRDVKKGEMITDDYSHWDGFAHAKGDQLNVHAQLKEWCGEDYKPWADAKD